MFKLDKKLVHKTIYISLVLQIITTLVSLKGFGVKLNDKDSVLQDILKLETGVQIVEAFVYLWITYSLNNFDTMISRRYTDWFITTPLMLLSTIIFMKYNLYKERNEHKKVTFKNFLLEDSDNIKKIVILNALMLIFGLLGEKRKINKTFSIMIGFVFFFWVFKLVYEEYVKGNETNKRLFYFVFIIWALYGFAAMAGNNLKNISYNGLDLIAKNFYGLYIYYKIVQLK